MVRLALFASLCVISLAASSAFGQAATSGNAAAVRPPQAGAPGGAAPAPRRPRPYDQCIREAQTRKYRGAERRHFVFRCQLGYGRRLFRRRGPVQQPT